MSIVRKLIKNEKGATAIEYGLIAALVAVAAIAGMRAIGGAANARFQNAASTMNTAN
jgi:pilus assembly protein Flp/PilA